MLGRKEWRRRWGYRRANDGPREWVLEVPDSADPHEDQFTKRAAAKRERVAKNELNRLRNIARAQKHKVPGVGLAPTPQPSKAELGQAIRVARTSTASAGRFQQKLPREQPAAARSAGQRRQFQPLIGDFSAEARRQLELLDVISSKKPRLDTTKAANRQLREDDQEQAAKRKKMRPKGRKGGKSQNRNSKGKGQHRKSGMKQPGKRK
ncbi:ribosome biogenesis regulatory protein homolog [Hemiscyllium ocellatum]|uniref:ribosome biogenesis regulatory protein homolog n=1 Tax=Hemiscyllium ocellatum TaxID=170820 RepID=UPI002966E9CA|nr:ribosome biogenesis regulatory protein homolog [Hemiscyllium ocellatum]